MNEDLEELRRRGVVFESAPCPMRCEGGDAVVLKGRDRVTGLPGTFTVVQCRTCGLRRTDPRPVPASMDIFYPDSYAPYHADVSAPSTDDPQSWFGRIVSALGLRSHTLPELRGGRLLEIGCASGHFLETMHRRGWAVEGIEYSAAAAASARAKGFSVQISTIENALPPAAQVDLVVGWMVAEHLHAPRAAFERLRGWSSQEGWLVLSVPDVSAIEAKLFGDAWYALQVPTHLYHYTPSTLTKLLGVSGWKVVRVRHQPNGMNLLNSMATALDDRGARRVASSVRAFAEQAKYAWARRVLGIVLGVLGQSGRMEIWAKAA